MKTETEQIDLPILYTVEQPEYPLIPKLLHALDIPQTLKFYFNTDFEEKTGA
jgi:hypothetical protein